MFDLPGREDVEKVVINRDVVEGKVEPLRVYSEKLKSKGSQG